MTWQILSAKSNYKLDLFFAVHYKGRTLFVNKLGSEIRSLTNDKNIIFPESKLLVVILLLKIQMESIIKLTMPNISFSASNINFKVIYIYTLFI